MNLQLIKNYCERRPGGLRQLAEEADMSEANLHRCIRNNKIQASDLEKLAILLKVRINVFFDEAEEAQVGCTHIEAHDHGQIAGRDINNGATLSADLVRLREKITHLEQRIKDKDATIAEKDKRIADKDELIKILRGV